MRAYLLSLTALLAGCRASASVENTLPVANLQSFSTVGLRVNTSAFASQGHAMSLEAAVLANLQQKCGFTQVGRAGGAPADVVLDLNITGMGRGGGGLISNPNVATIDTLLVLSDGVNGELLGTAKIRGKSGGMQINNNVPETAAIEIIATTIGDLLAKSGCSGPRIARVQEPPPQVVQGSTGQSGSAGNGSGTTLTAVNAAGSGSSTGVVTLGSPPPIDDARRAQAETLNEDGKVKLRSADVPGARAAFQQAVAIIPDARYEFNICLTFEAQEQWDKAIATCRRARTMNPQPALLTKIDYRLEQYARKK